MNKTLKEYELKESIFVLHSVLEALNEKYQWFYPENIKTQVLTLIHDTDELINEKDEFQNYDIENEELFIRVEYKK